MIPLNDTESNRYTSFPFMTVTLIIINVFMFIAQDLVLESSMESYIKLIHVYGSVPVLMLGEEGGGALSSITHMFMHGGLLHLAGNMLALWVFGRRVEDVTGPWRFLAFYLAVGLFADIISTVSRFDSPIPGIGASGAVYGVMAAYLIIFPKGRIRTLVFISFIPLWPKLRAYWIILYFVLLQIPIAFQVLLFDADSSVAHWAHLGGFFGGLFIFFFLRPDAFHRYRNELPL